MLVMASEFGIILESGGDDYKFFQVHARVKLLKRVRLLFYDL